MIPFTSWDGDTDPTNTASVVELERFFGPGAVTFNSYQNAIAAILEILGSRTQAVPVVLPVTTSPDTIAGVLRGGGNPLLVDIDPQTLQIAPEALAEVLDEIQAAVVVLTRPGGLPVDQRLLDMTKDMPTILDTKMVPEDLLSFERCTFMVFDFEPMVGSGALVYHTYTDQVREMKRVRGGVLGMSAGLNPILAEKLLEELKHMLRNQNFIRKSDVYAEASEKYKTLLGERCIVCTNNCPYIIVEVENAAKAVAHLHSHGFTAVHAVFPLHLLSELNQRWTETPSYPVAEDLHKKLVALPVHSGILDKIDIIAEKLLEVA